MHLPERLLSTKEAHTTVTPAIRAILGRIVIAIAALMPVGRASASMSEYNGLDSHPVSSQENKCPPEIERLQKEHKDLIRIERSNLIDELFMRSIRNKQDNDRPSIPIELIRQLMDLIEEEMLEHK